GAGERLRGRLPVAGDADGDREELVGGHGEGDVDRSAALVERYHRPVRGTGQRERRRAGRIHVYRYRVRLDQRAAGRHPDRGDGVVPGVREADGIDAAAAGVVPDRLDAVEADPGLGVGDDRLLAPAEIRRDPEEVGTGIR